MFRHEQSFEFAGLHLNQETKHILCLLAKGKKNFKKMALKELYLIHR